MLLTRCLRQIFITSLKSPQFISLVDFRFPVRFTSTTGVHPISPSQQLQMSQNLYSVVADNSAIEKPSLDDRSYRFIKLNSNNLHVLLINDPKADKSAASLDVNVGSFGDKQYNVSGLAHFCEHLLFMGTEKYPEENEYSKYLSAHSGHSNAYTASEHTNYYFEVSSDYLEGALDRFAQFFISPLFSKSCQDREIKAVDSENKKNLQNDVWRFYQLEKHTSNPKHPFNGFSTGNFETLNNQPIKEGLDVRDVLIEFHKSHYSANLMSLVVLGKEDLDQLAVWAINYFSEIPNSDLDRPSYNNEQVFTEAELGKIIKAKPIMDTHKLELNFMIPDDQNDNWASKPGNYFSHLLGHESKGSLLYYLKEKNWVNEISTGNMEICKDNSFFVIEADLTTKGVDEWQSVVVHIFEYLKLILDDEPQFWIWNEVSNMSKVNFKFTQKTVASSTVSRLSNKLYKYNEDSYIPPEYLLSSGIAREFDADKIKEYGKYLNPHNFRITLSSQKLQDLNLTEKWYGTEYSFEDIPQDLIKSLETVSLNPRLHYPVPNKFIPSNFEVTGTKSETPLPHLYLIDENEKFHVWFKQDDQFEVPKGSIELKLFLPPISKSINSALSTMLLVDLIDDELNDISYYATLVGLHFSIFQTTNSIEIKVSGYNDKLSVLFQEILTKITNFEPNRDRFDTIKDKAVQDLKNFGYKVPFQQIFAYFRNLIYDKSYTHKDRFELLQRNDIKFEDLAEFNKTLWSEGVFGQVIIHGNFKYEDAVSISEATQKTFKDFPTSVKSEDDLNDQILTHHYIVPSGDRQRYEVELQDPKDINSCIDYCIHLDDEVINDKTRVLTDLLATIIHEPCFNQLRTKEQLGYVVFSGARVISSRNCFRILIQSERSCEYLEYRIEEFLNHFRHHFVEDLTEEGFNKFKQALKDKKLVKLKNLSEEFQRLKIAVVDGRYDFKQRARHVEVLESITKEDFVQFFDTYIDPKNEKLKSGISSVYLKSQCVPQVPHSKLLSSSLSNYIYANNIAISSDKLDEIIQEHKEDLPKIVDSLVEQIYAGQDVDLDTHKKDLQNNIELQLLQPVPESYPRGHLVDSIADFRSTHKLGETVSPIEPLSNFYYRKSDNAHL